MRDISWREMMALKATAEPMLMRERRQVIKQVKRIAFRGTGVLLRPCDGQLA
jgi:hypothetical protein